MGYAGIWLAALLGKYIAVTVQLYDIMMMTSMTFANNVRRCLIVIGAQGLSPKCPDQRIRVDKHGYSRPPDLSLPKL